MRGQGTEDGGEGGGEGGAGEVLGEDEKDVCEGAEPDERLLDLGARRDGSSRERTGRMEEEGGQYGQRVEERKK